MLINRVLLKTIFTHTCTSVCYNTCHWVNWTITNLDKHILVLHHQRIGVNVSGEWLALVGVCAVLQLASDIQRLCSHKHTKTRTYQAEASAVVLTNEDRQFSPTAKWPLLPSCTTRVTKLVPVREEPRGGEDRSPERPIAFFAFNHGAGGEAVLTR